MARCEEGYLCLVCGKDVEEIFESDLYLRYVIGWVDPETLHTTRECHIRCNPTLAQFIDDERFQPPVVVEGPWSRDQLDPHFAEERSRLVTRGYARLWEIFNEEVRPDVIDYPLVPFGKERETL
ncbi:MAG: hypothetical protein U0905_13230 [Pirellulales bacterium]